MRYSVSVIGLGFVGLSLASFLSSKQVIVTGIDNDEKKINLIKKGISPFYEPGIEKFLKKALNSNMTLDTQISKKTISTLLN